MIMKKIIKIIASIMAVMTFTFIAVVKAEAATLYGFPIWHYVTYDASSNFSASAMRQVSNQAALSNTCGAMSLLTVLNYQSCIAGACPTFTNNRPGVESAITRLYEWLPKTKNSYLDAGKDMKRIMIDRWGWKNVALRSSSVYRTFDASYKQLMADIDGGRPAITLMKASDPVFSPKNSKGVPSPVQHFVVIYSASDANVFYADPWDGKIKRASKDQFKNAWVSTFISLVGKP